MAKVEEITELDHFVQTLSTSQRAFFEVYMQQHEASLQKSFSMASATLSQIGQLLNEANAFNQGVLSNMESSR